MRDSFGIFEIYAQRLKIVFIKVPRRVSRDDETGTRKKREVRRYKTHKVY